MNPENSQKISCNRDDLMRLLTHIAHSSPWRENYHSMDYCEHCGKNVGNVFIERQNGKTEEELHEPDCVYLLAHKMLKEIE